MKKRKFILVLILGTVFYPMFAIALDTTETFDVGFTDVEIYFGADNIGNGDEASYNFTPLLGIGLVDRLSLAIETSWSVVPKFYGSINNITTTIFGTPVETEILDVDIWLGVSDNFIDDEQLSAFLGGEVNLDFKPAGFYVRPNFSWTRINLDEEESNETEITKARVLDMLIYSMDAAFGGYANIGEKIQLFAEYGQTWERTEDEYEDIGKYFAVGLNWLFLDTTELITEVGWSTDNESDSFFASIGFIFSVGQQ